MDLRTEVAAVILDIWEGGNALEWARGYLDKCKDNFHGGDCGKCPPEMRAPVTCDRCVCDDFLGAADRIIAMVRAY